MKSDRSSHVAISFQQRLDSAPEVTLDELRRLSADVKLAEFAELLQLHQMHHWKQGDCIQVEAYLEQIPRLAEAESCDALLDLIYSEIVLFSERGRVPELAEFLRRFPQHEQRIRNLFLIHDALAADAPSNSTSVATIDMPERDTGKPADTKPDHMLDATGSLPRLPGYESLSLLGCGGMGIVFQARQIDLDRIVAVKMIRAGGLATDVDVARFRREAHLVANLHHPNIVAVYDFGELQGHPYFTMEFVEGVPLSKVVAQQAIDVTTAVRYVRALSAAVAYAHSQGVVHRDIKPSNVIVARQDNLKLLDFGLSFHHETGRDLTATGTVLGTPAYMATEQARGEAATPLSDVYSLAAVLFELLAGRPPFAANTAVATLQASLASDAPRLRTIDPRIPRDLETLVAKCLSKEPADRIASAQELTDELDRFLRDEPIHARRLSVPARSMRWCRRNRVVAALLGLVFLTLVTGTATSVFYAVQAQQRANRARQAAERERQAADHADAKSREAEQARQAAQQNEQRAVASEAVAKQETLAARRSLYASEIMLAQYAAETGNLQRARNLLNRAWVPPGEADLRRLEWYLLWESLHSQRLAFAGHVNRLINIAFFPDGNRIATSGPGSDVLIHDVRSGMPLQRLRTPALDQQNIVLVSHDGKYLVSGIGRIFVWNAESGELVRVLTVNREIGETLVAQCGAMHPSKNLLATGQGVTSGSGGDSEVKLWDIETGEQLRRFGEPSTSKNWVYGIRFSPDGKWIASVGADRLVKIWDTETGELVQSMEGHTAHVNGIVFTGEGQVITGSWDNTIRVWDVATGVCEQVLTGHRGIVRDVDLSPDGRTIVSAGGTDNLVILWDRQTGNLIKKLAGHPSMVWRARFSPDGSQIVSCGDGLRHEHDPSSTGVAGVIKVWDVARGEEVLPSMAWGAVGPHNRLRGRCLIVGQHYDRRTNGLWTAFDDGHVECLDCATLELRFEGDIPDVEPISMAIQPGGKHLALYCYDLTVRLYDSATLRELSRVEVPEHDVNETFRLAFHPSKPAIVVGSFWPARVWYFAEHRLTNSESLAGGVCPTFSPDGNVLAMGHNDELILWDWKTQEHIDSNKSAHSSRIFKITFSPDASRCATTAGDGLVVLWQCRPLKPLQVFEGHVSGSTDVAFSPDGSRLISSGKDGTVRIWSVDLGVELLTIRGFGHEVQSVTFDESGQRLFVAVRRFFGANNTTAQTRVFRIPSEDDCVHAVLQPAAVFQPQSSEERLARALVSWRCGALLQPEDSARPKHLQQALDLLQRTAPTEANRAAIEAWTAQLKTEITGE